MKDKTHNILIGFLLVCMFIFKFIVFYTTAGISLISFSFPFSLLFFGMVLYLIFSNRRWSIRKKWGWYLAWNVLVSGLMFIDLYYNSYFDQFPVIALLGQLSMLDHLQKTMAKMFNFAFVVILLDLPVLAVLTAKKVSFSIPKCVAARVGSVAIMAVYLLTVVLPTTPVDMVTALQRSEIFSFHGHDVRNFLTGYNSVQRWRHWRRMRMRRSPCRRFQSPGITAWRRGGISLSSSWSPFRIFLSVRPMMGR